MPRITFSAVTLSGNGVDEENGILRGAIVASKGEAKGHGLYLGDKFLDQLATTKSAAVRVDPPGEEVHGGAMAIEGEAVNFRRDGDDVRADIQLFELPGGKRERILKLAKTAAHLFGLSLDLTYKVLRTTKDKLKEIIPTTVSAVDFVKDPAAARALFQEQVDTTPEVIMNYDFIRKQCAKFSIAFPATDAEVTAEIAAKAQTDLEAKFSAITTEADELKAKLSNLEKKPETKPEVLDYDKLTESVVAKLQAKGLASVAAKPVAPAPVAEEVKPDVQLAAKVNGLAAKLKQKPEDVQAQFAKLSADEQAVCLRLNLDPTEFAANKAKFGKLTESMPL